MEAIIADARAVGVESLVLDVRGNNHGAEAMHRSLGFLEAGVLADDIAVGDDRFDLVTYQLPLALAAGVRRHGRRREGLGAS
jgi:L-amino acid N-acyltransferase YncA